MALIQRLLQHSRDKQRRSTWGCGGSKKDQNFDSPEVLTSYKCWQAPVLDNKQIRLLIYKECDVKGKKVIVDSKAIHKVDQQGTPGINLSPCSKFGKCSPLVDKGKAGPKTPEKTPSSSNIVDGYRFMRPGSDVKMLGEMLFGSIPMSSNESMIKVHTFKMPPKLMLSRVFLLKPPKEQLETEGGDKDSISLYCADMTIPKSISANNLPSLEMARSMPIAMPPSPGGSVLDDESGEFSASGSFLSPFPPSPGSSVSSSASNSSLHRRWLRNQVTSMENMVRRRSSENISSPEELIRPRKRYPKIGVAIIFSLPEGPLGGVTMGTEEEQTFRRFFFSHFSLLEGHFQQLVTAIERALIFQRKSFIRPVMEALEHFKLTVIQLYTAPRIQRPIWLNLMTYPQQRGQLCAHLVKELGTLLDAHNSRQNNFFMSRLMTGVLMHHLAWVPTVMPAGSAPSRAFLDKHSSSTLDLLAKSHPYNPLWAQLGDMYGTIGLPNRVAKTIVVGKRAEVVCRLLYVLSYFIRCSEVHEISEKCDETIADFPTMEHSPPIPDCCEDCTGTEDSLVKRDSSESALAKTEDSGIEDVGALLRSDRSSSAKPVFYFQESGGRDDERLVETSSDDGVSLDSEATSEGAVKQLQRIQQTKCNSCNPVLQSPRLGVRKGKGFEDSDEVFKCSEVDRESPNVSRTQAEKDDIVKVQSMIDKNANTTGTSTLIACKNIDTTMLIPKREVATPVGRAPKNIDDFLRFDTDEPVSRTLKAKASNNIQPRTLQYAEQPQSCETDRNSAQSKVCEESLRDSESRVCPESCSLSLTGDVSSDSKKTHNTASQPIEIVDKMCQRTGDPSECASTCDRCRIACNQCSNQSVHTSNTCSTTCNQSNLCSSSCSHCASSSSQCTGCLNASTAKKSHTSSSACQLPSLTTSKQPPFHRTAIVPPDGGGPHASERGEKYDLYHRSVSSMSVVSCASSSLSHLSDHTCLEHEEIPLASSEQVFELELEQTKSHVDSFGRSLLGGYCQQFVPDFALQGVPHLDDKSVEQNLMESAEHPVLDDAMSEAVYLVADTDAWTVDVVSCERYHGAGGKPSRQEVTTSSLVDQLLESVMLLQRMKLSADFCLMHLENRLQEMYFQSASVASYLEHRPMAKACALAGAVGVDCSDLPLLLAVASVHSPHVIANVMRETIEQQRGLVALQQESP